MTRCSPSGWWHEVESSVDASDGDSDADELADTCASVGSTGHPLPTRFRISPWKEHVSDYPVLTQGQVSLSFMERRR